MSFFEEAFAAVSNASAAFHTDSDGLPSSRIVDGVDWSCLDQQVDKGNQGHRDGDTLAVNGTQYGFHEGTNSHRYGADEPSNSHVIGAHNTINDGYHQPYAGPTKRTIYLPASVDTAKRTIYHPVHVGTTQRTSHHQSPGDTTKRTICHPAGLGATKRTIHNPAYVSTTKRTIHHPPGNSGVSEDTEEKVLCRLKLGFYSCSGCYHCSGVVLNVLDKLCRGKQRERRAMLAARRNAGWAAAQLNHEANADVVKPECKLNQKVWRVSLRPLRSRGALRLLVTMQEESTRRPVWPRRQARTQSGDLQILCGKRTVRESLRLASSFCGRLYWLTTRASCRTAQRMNWYLCWRKTLYGLPSESQRSR